GRRDRAARQVGRAGRGGRPRSVPRLVPGLVRLGCHARRPRWGRDARIPRRRRCQQGRSVTQMVCQDRVVIVTGAGRGIGRAHALAFAEAGAKVVVNDVGVALDGSDTGEGPADQVVSEIEARGGKAVANTDDVADFDGAQHLVQEAIEHFGQLDVLLNNAGFVRDRMLVNLSEDEWDAVIRVHLKGHFATVKHAARHWRERSKAGENPQARVINTSSGAGLLGSVGQANYSAAKAGIAGLTVVSAAELGRYGVTVNAIAPAARTRMTEEVFADDMATPESGFDAMAPENISPLAV